MGMMLSEKNAKRMFSYFFLSADQKQNEPCNETILWRTCIISDNNNNNNPPDSKGVARRAILCQFDAGIFVAVVATAMARTAADVLERRQ